MTRRTPNPKGRRQPRDLAAEGFPIGVSEVLSSRFSIEDDEYGRSVVLRDAQRVH